MPYPNEHSARLKDPKQYDEFRRVNNKFGSGIHAIFGIKKKPKRKSELQAIRFNAKKFTVAQAKKWLKEHDHKPIRFEPATGKGKQTATLAEMLAGDSGKIQVPTSALQFREDDAVELVELAEGEPEKKRPRFRMRAYSGKPILNHWWWGRIIIDVSGMSVSKKPIPILREHDRMRIVGHADKKILENSVVLEGNFSEVTVDGQEVLALLREKHPWQGSISIQMLKLERLEDGKKVTVNGHSFNGPGYIGRKSRLRESSFCALGADEDTGATALGERGEYVELTIDNLEVEMAGKQTGAVEVKELTADQVVEMLPEAVENWKNEGREEGLEKGREEGRKEGAEAERKRFEDLKAAIPDRLEFVVEQYLAGVDVSAAKIALGPILEKEIEGLKTKLEAGAEGTIFRTTQGAAGAEGEKPKDFEAALEKVRKEGEGKLSEADVLRTAVSRWPDLHEKYIEEANKEK